MAIIISYLLNALFSCIALALYIRKVRLDRYKLAVQRYNRELDEAVRGSDTPIGDRLAREMGLNF